MDGKQNLRDSLVVQSWKLPWFGQKKRNNFSLFLTFEPLLLFHLRLIFQTMTSKVLTDIFVANMEYLTTNQCSFHHLQVRQRAPLVLCSSERSWRGGCFFFSYYCSWTSCTDYWKNPREGEVCRVLRSFPKLLLQTRWLTLQKQNQIGLSEVNFGRRL